MSLRRVQMALRDGEFSFVFRTDIRGYYQHIRKDQIENQFNRYVNDGVLQELFHQYARYSVESAGEFHTPEFGIPRGCALSPIIGASHLFHIDSYFAVQDEMLYSRYMDDFLILTKTRWKLRKAIKQLNAFFDLGGFEQHPDKTRLGRLSAGFDWLGLAFNESGAAGIAPRAQLNHQERCLRLYEQSRLKGLTDSEANERVQAYMIRWDRWANSIMRCVTDLS